MRFLHACGGRAELCAALRAAEGAQPRGGCLVVTDCKYVAEGISKILDGKATDTSAATRHESVRHATLATSCVFDAAGGYSRRAGCASIGLRANITKESATLGCEADPTQLPPSQASEYAETVFAAGLQSDDQLFHVAIYQWLVEQGQFDR